MKRRTFIKSAGVAAGMMAARGNLNIEFSFWYLYELI